LSYANEKGNVVPVYILDETCPSHFKLGSASKWWLQQSLEKLNVSLEEKLHIQKGDPLALLIDWVKQHKITQVVWNRCYEPWQISRDTKIKQALIDLGIEVKSFNGHLLWEPWQVLKKDETPYRVFTPYYRKGCLSKPAPRIPTPKPDNLSIQYTDEQNHGLATLNLMPSINWYQQMAEQWQPGEQGAADRLAEFVSQKVNQYKAKRDFPDLEATSGLGAHLHFGEISVHQVWYSAIDACNGNTEDPGLDCFLSELGWREFSHYLLYHFPTIPKENFSPKFSHFPWRKDDQALKAWQQGNTGIPMVDAGMRQLWQTGTMHNRVRMLVGSFLVKNLLIDWRSGERWFWDCLLDADLAANSASWQWVAGTGADAAPYFRIFNPVTQGEKFDKSGDYVRSYCPELSELPDKYIHAPWDAPQEILNQAKVVLGENYPKPIVDLKASRQRALDALQQNKALSQSEP
jgi:deoxyribodipyrimidine photo-lyase